MVNKKKIFKTLGLTMAATVLMVTPAVAQITSYHFELDMEYGNEEHTGLVTKDNNNSYAYITVDDGNVISTDEFFMSVNGPYFYNYNYTGKVRISNSQAEYTPPYNQPEKPQMGNNYRLRGVTEKLNVWAEGEWES